jgi:DNA adenine methylase
VKTVWLRWAGSKWRSLNNLRTIFDRYHYDLYVEPFLGAGSVFFNLNTCRRAILSDSNADLMSFYKHLRSNPSRMRTMLDDFPRVVSSRMYYRIRGTFNRSRPSYLRSAKFFFLNRVCFNGVYRVNQFGDFNVPVGSRKRFRTPAIEDLLQLSLVLDLATLHRADFWSTRRHARPGALFYIDPPYTANGRAQVFDRYCWPPFREADLLRLGRFLDSIAKKGAAVIVSFAGENRPSFVPKYFHLKTFPVYRSISYNGSRAHQPEICAYYP